MDERKISEVFTAAVGDVPPPSFEHGDVLARSARLTRKRNSLVAGSALGFALLVGGITAGVGLWSGPSGGSNNDSAAAPPAPALERNTNPVPNEVSTDNNPRIAEADPGSPSSTPKQGGSTSGDVGPSADGTPGGCGTVDGELAAALAGELPSAVSRGKDRSAPLSCPTGSRSAAFEVTEGPLRGLVSIMLTPAGTGQMLQPPWGDRSGATGSVSATKSGATLVLSVEGVSGSAAPPITEDDLRSIAGKLATRY
ncbi:hypothetical protein [Actinokineospora cianjurensis]|uniref:Uncharacterized protein n=1 Tax=Actinokineospora cianjurensis TaxID=585224 RepID=A0A421B7C8_9PSEU|nr:hypothetical protein [Actinokineospora cianjurensis]RLK60392.1 hypothetical protein CLV68_0895 [Actinokineospora cianjurensis]